MARQLADDAFATDAGTEETRRRYGIERAFWNEGGPAMASRVDDTVPGPAGDVRIRLFTPPSAVGEDRRPSLVYLHGGGFVVGNLDTHDRIMRSLAAKTGAVVVGVDYALAPEAKFPRALEECAAVVSWLQRRADALGLDEGRISFAGDSSGANLSLATALFLRDTVSDWPGAQCLLLYYGLFGLTDSASRRLYGGSWDGLARADLEYYMAAYTRGPDDLSSPYLDCLSADLAGAVPPCFIAACSLDPLRDDSVALAAALAERGVNHQLVMFDRVLHGFLHYSRERPEAMDALDAGAAFYRSVVEAAPPPSGAARRDCQDTKHDSQEAG
jgi:acetyl esterase